MGRRTQQERSESTKAALIDAALALLDERGWAATTSVAVCERAEVTRGALVHHFGDLPALLAAALETHYARWAEVLADEPPPGSLADLVMQSWRVIDEGGAKVVIEAWLAAANDAELGRAIGPVVAGFAKLVSPTEHHLVADDDTRDLYLTLRETLLGLALGRATNGGPLPHEEAVLTRLAAIARAHDGAHQRSHQ